MKKIVFPDAGENILSLLGQDLVDQLETVGSLEIYKGTPASETDFMERTKNANAILLGWNIPNQVIEKCPELELIAYLGYGVHNFVDVSFAKKRGIQVANTPNYGNHAVAEHTLALLLSLAKHLSTYDDQIRQGKWKHTLTSIELKNKTIGIVGVGGIGQQMINYCKALEMNVLCWTFHPSKQRAEKLGVTFVSLDELFQQSDIISLHLPYTNKTKGIINEALLNKIKPGALFINTARAELVDTEAFIRALESGRIKGAGIDVFDEEPLPTDHPLLTLDNVILTPHVAFNTIESTKNILEIAVDNVVSFFRGKPKNIVTL